MNSTVWRKRPVFLFSSLFFVSASRLCLEVKALSLNDSQHLDLVVGTISLGPRRGLLLRVQLRPLALWMLRVFSSLLEWLKLDSADCVVCRKRSSISYGIYDF